jgi:hypothetical protein
MPITRDLTNGNKVTDWTKEVNEIDNQYGLINSKGLFEGTGVSQESIIFDKNLITRTLIPQSSKRGGEHSKGKDRKVETYALALPYFSHQDYVTPQDIQGWRQAGTDDKPRLLATAIADKWEDMKADFDQTSEYMKIRALTGSTVDPEGNVIADMFTVLGTTQETIDFELTNATADIDGTIAQLKRSVAKNAKAGGRIGRIEIMVTPEFFDALVSHPKLREAYLQYQASAPSDTIRADLARFESWGVVDTFVHKGMMFYSYDAEFNIESTGAGSVDGIQVVKAFETLDGTGAVVKDFANDQGGYTIVNGVSGAYRAYFGPANTLSGANSVGSEVHAYQYRDPKDKFHELELESAPLYILTKPQLAVKVTAS